MGATGTSEPRGVALAVLLALSLATGCAEVPAEGGPVRRNGPCDGFDGEAALPSLAIGAVLGLRASWEPDLAAKTLSERVLGRRGFRIAAEASPAGLAVGPGEVGYRFEVEPGEALRLGRDRASAEALRAFWEARLGRLVAALEADPWVAAATAEVDGEPLSSGSVEPCGPVEPGEPPLEGCLEVDDPGWHLEDHAHAANVRAAWRAFESLGLEPGEGVVVAHIDTGYQPSPELGLGGAGPSPVLVAEGVNTIPRERQEGLDARDRMGGGVYDGFGHGLATATLLVSPPGLQVPDAAPPDLVFSRGGVSGVAPGARLLPIRWSNGVIVDVFNAPQLAEAIVVAADAGADVASMSLGGAALSRRVLLERAARDAARRGVVLVAAAGNATGSVLGVSEPGRLPETIAVTAADFWGGPWRGGPLAGSNYGPEADVGAPACDVHTGRSAPVRKGEDGLIFDTQVGGVGTSLSTAVVAGAAALWVSLHGRDELRARYCRRDGAGETCAGIPAAFLYLVQAEAGHRPWAPGAVPPGRDYGVGTIDVAGVVLAELPTFEDLCGTATGTRGFVRSDLVARFGLPCEE